MTYLWFPYWAMSWNARSHACFPVVWRDRCNHSRSCHYQAERTLRLGCEWWQYGNRPRAEERAECIVRWLQQIWTPDMDFPPEHSQLCAYIAKHLFCFVRFALQYMQHIKPLKNPGSKQFEIYNHFFFPPQSCVIYTSMYRYLPLWKLM